MCKLRFFLYTVAVRFHIEKKVKGRMGRAGILETAHGAIHTPAFVAVGTKATVKAVAPDALRALGAEVVLGNAYHLYLEPGEKTVARAGGFGKFMGWDGPTMTDSGGFQIFSLGAGFGRHTAKIRPHLHHSKHRVFTEERCGVIFVQIDEDGAIFRSHRDGSKHRFTPERSIEIQHALGADIIFAFDECTSPDAPYKYQKQAMERTHRWALRSLEANRRLTRIRTRIDADKSYQRTSALHQRPSALFGIVQGGRHEDLRKQSARTVGKMDFDGFGIGGSFGREDMGNAVRSVNEILPEDKPRHLLGIGGIEDLFSAVENGCDTFDCVSPTREARTGSLYTKRGRINITNARFRTEFTPIDTACECYTCCNFTRAYLAHLFRSREILAYSLASVHNLSFFINLVQNMRQAILGGVFHKFRKEFLLHYKS